MIGGNNRTTLPRRGGGRRRVILLPEEWPAIDQASWKAARSSAARFDRRSNAWDWRPDTVANVQRAYGFFLAWLEAGGKLDPDVKPQSRVSKETVSSFVLQMRDWRHSEGSIASTIARLAMAIKAITDNPPRDQQWRWLTTFAVRLQPRHTDAKIIESARATNTIGLMELGERLMEQTHSPFDGTGNIVSVGAARTFRDGLLVTFQAQAALRPRNLLALQIGSSLIRDPGGWRVQLTTDQTKTGIPINFAVEHDISLAMDTYVSVYRPVLLLTGSLTETSFWLSSGGRPLSYKAAWEISTRLTRRAFALPISLHRYRHVAVTTIAVQSPEMMRTVSAALSHGRLDTTLRYYALADNMEASRHLRSAVHEARGAMPEILRSPTKISSVRRPKREPS